jgi:predicted N-acetyltransferase YhbS
MIIEAIHETALSEGDEAAIAALLSDCFDTDFGGRSFFMQRHHLRLIARDGGRVIGHMALLYRAMRLGDRLIDVTGLAEVATAPDRRGEGIAGRMLERAIAEARAMGSDFFLLYGSAGLYSGAGFRTIRNTTRLVTMLGARTGGVTVERSDHLMMLPLGEAVWDEDAMLDLCGHIF